MKVRDAAALRRWRLRADLTQTDLAALCRCKQQTISLLESGKLSAVTEDLALAISRRLNVPWEDLFEPRDASAMAQSASGAGSAHEIARSA